jgi:spore coat polysaccharide biosynthesis protein SpsF (cytidylyltransferase family)
VKQSEGSRNVGLVVDSHQHSLSNEGSITRKNLKMKTWKSIGIVMIVLAVGTLGYVSVSVAEEGKNVEQMIVDAKTPADHEAIAAYYDQEAKAAHQKHEEHLKLKASYEKIPHLASKTSLPWHCSTIAENYNKSAKEYEALAKLHRDMAKSAK